MDLRLGFLVKDLPKYFNNFAFRTNLPASAEIGAEFEVEGSRLPDPALFKYHWFVENDGSLRGRYWQECAEYVLKNPVSVAYFKSKSFPYLTKIMRRNKAKPKFSGRCSTHIHVNVQNMYIYQVIVFALLYYIFEDIALRLAGQERSGNLFCIGANNSDVFSEAIKQAMESNINELVNDGAKYAAVNFNSIPKYGSLEFRALRGTFNQNEVYNWIDFLFALKNHAASMAPEDAGNVLDALSLARPHVYLRNILREHPNLYDKLRRDCGGVDSMDRTIYNCARNVQSVIYDVNWSRIVSLAPANNPFIVLREHRRTDQITEDEYFTMFKWLNRRGLELFETAHLNDEQLLPKRAVKKNKKTAAYTLTEERIQNATRQMRQSLRDRPMPLNFTRATVFDDIDF